MANESRGFTMTAGYSGTPLAKKLDIKPGFRIHVENAPADYRELLGPLPANVTFAEATESDLDMIHLFTDSAKDLGDRLNGCLMKIKSNGAIWISWPKQASKVPTDLTEEVVRKLALATSLVDVKVCAVDGVWSALKLVIRAEKRW